MLSKARLARLRRRRAQPFPLMALGMLALLMVQGRGGAPLPTVLRMSRRVIRTLRRLGYLETGIDAAVATGYDPLLDAKPELARTMAASVKQRIAFGKRAGQQVRRIGSGSGIEDGVTKDITHGGHLLSAP